MNRKAADVPDWPKWVDAECDKCGEFVPKAHVHICDEEFEKDALARREARERRQRDRC